MAMYRFTINSQLPPQIITQRIQLMTGKWPSFSESFNDCFKKSAARNYQFIGSVSESSFKICRNIKYRNSWLPIIKGQITKTKNGSQIKVTMNVHILVTIFMSLWLTGNGFGSYLSLFGSNEGGNLGMTPVWMFMAGILMSILGFYPEALIAHRLLKGTLLSTSA